MTVDTTNLWKNMKVDTVNLWKNMAMIIYNESLEEHDHDTMNPLEEHDNNTMNHWSNMTVIHWTIEET